VSELRRGSPAEAAGIALNDEIVAVNDVPVSQVPLAPALARIAAASNARLTLARRGVAYAVDVTVAADPSQAWSLVVRPNTTPAQAQHRGAWLGY
jgi:predicted metalloprotease with PDZ domain